MYEIFANIRCDFCLQRVDLRDNNIQISGLVALLESLKENISLIRLDLDKLPRKSAFTVRIFVKKLIDTSSRYFNGGNFALRRTLQATRLLSKIM